MTFNYIKLITMHNTIANRNKLKLNKTSTPEMQQQDIYNLLILNHLSTKNLQEPNNLPLQPQAQYTRSSYSESQICHPKKHQTPGPESN